jgi:hypothetical protein
MSDPDLDGLESGEGWLYASSLPLGKTRLADQLPAAPARAEFRPETPSTIIDAGWLGRGEFNYYATADAGALEPIALSNRRQAWTVGARWALATRWDGRRR